MSCGRVAVFCVALLLVQVGFAQNTTNSTPNTFAQALNEVSQANTAPSKPLTSNNNQNPDNSQTPKEQTSADETPIPMAGDAVPANPHDPNAPTLLDGLTPNDSALSVANVKLLAENAQLTRQVDDLTTQVNVLVEERSGQLFVYGAMTAIFSMIIGFVFAKLMARQRW